MTFSLFDIPLDVVLVMVTSSSQLGYEGSSVLNAESYDSLVDQLVAQANEKRLLLFVGSGLSKCIVGQRALSWHELLKKVADYLSVDTQLVCSTRPDMQIFDYPQIASNIVQSYAEKKCGGDIEKSCLKVKQCVCALCDWYPDGKDKRTWQKIFNSIGPSVIVTTNYDLVLESLLGSNCCSYSSQDTLPITVGKKHLIYHLHGVCNRPNEIVLTREDYVRALFPYSYRHNRLITLLQENTVLFVGYSKNDVNVLSAQFIASQGGIFDLTSPLPRSVYLEYCDHTDAVHSFRSTQLLDSFTIQCGNVQTFLDELSKRCALLQTKVREAYEKFMDEVSNWSAEGKYEEGGYCSKANDEVGQKMEQDRLSFMRNMKRLANHNDFASGIIMAYTENMKAKYREVRNEAKKPQKWENYTRAWKVLAEYFSLLSPQQTQSEGNLFQPYTEVFKYALGWFNGLAYFLRPEHGRARAAFCAFQEDWTKSLKEATKELILDYAELHNFKEIIKLVGCAESSCEIPARLCKLDVIGHGNAE